MNVEQNRSLKTFFILAIIISLLVTILSFTFSYFYANANGKKEASAKSAHLGLELSADKITSSETVGLMPLSDNQLRSAILASNKCVDSKGKGRCQIYKVNVTNTGNVVATLWGKLKLEAIGENSKFTNLKWAELNNIEDANVFGDIHTMNDIDWKNVYAIGPGATTSFYVAVWISDTGYQQNKEDNGHFMGTVTFESTAGMSTNATFIG